MTPEPQFRYFKFADNYDDSYFWRVPAGSCGEPGSMGLSSNAQLFTNTGWKEIGFINMHRLVETTATGTALSKIPPSFAFDPQRAKTALAKTPSDEAIAKARAQLDRMFGDDMVEAETPDAGGGCSVCGEPWKDHDIGVPHPTCPKPPLPGKSWASQDAGSGGEVCSECLGVGRVGSEGDCWPCEHCDGSGITPPEPGAGGAVDEDHLAVTCGECGKLETVLFDAGGEPVYSECRHCKPTEPGESRTATCACTLAEPCSDNCSCAHPLRSGGCSRCASYGSPEQQREAAERIAAKDKELAAALAEVNPNLASELVHAEAEIKRLRAGLEVAKNVIGPHMIRSCGTCRECGGTTPNGTMHWCRKCSAKIINEALTPAGGGEEGV